MKRSFSIPISAAAFLALIAWNAAAKEGAAWGAQLFCQLLLPSLLPYFVLSQLLNRLGLPQLLSRRCGGVTERCFALPGCATSPLLLGLCGGYPLGASAAAELFRSGELEREEAERLLFFCDNTGPAFAVAALGGGALGSVGWGIVLYLVHMLSALLLGLCAARGQERMPRSAPLRHDAAPLPFARALTESVAAAGSAMLHVGFFVVFFSAVLFVLDALGALHLLEGLLAALTGWEAAYCRTAVWSLFELSGTVGLLRELPLSPLSLTLASFALSWGGLCVHLQSVAVTAPCDLSGRQRAAGKLLHGLLAGALMYIMSTIVFALAPSILP